MLKIGNFTFPEPHTDEVYDWKPHITHHSLDTHVLAVAKTRVEGAWAAYIGAVPGHDHTWEANSVLRLGTKLSEEIALMLFPQFRGIPYAR